MEIVVIGGSTGAIDALLAIVPALPDTFETPVMIALHDHERMAELLAMRCSRPVCQAEDGQPIRGGTVYIAPRDHHLRVERDGSCAVSADDAEPSIDKLFASAVDAFGASVTGVVLSGGNDDGARGLARIFAAGGCTIIQAPSAAEQLAMPAAALHHVRDAHVLGIDQIAMFLARRT